MIGCQLIMSILLACTLLVLFCNCFVRESSTSESAALNEEEKLKSEMSQLLAPILFCPSLHYCYYLITLFPSSSSAKSINTSSPFSFPLLQSHQSGQHSEVGGLPGNSHICCGKQKGIKTLLSVPQIHYCKLLLLPL